MVIIMGTVTNENVTSLFDWSNVHDDIEGIKMYSLFDRSSASAKNSLAEWLWGMAYEEQWEKEVKSPVERCQTVSDNFTKRVQAACDYITSERAGEYRLEVARAKLTGNSAIAGAYKKLNLAILNGADLREVRSASACQQFNTKVNKDNEADQLAIRRRKEAELDAIDEGLEPGTEEFEKEVEAIIQEAIRLASEEIETNGSAPAAAAPKDKFDLMGGEIADALRHLHALEMGDKSEVAADNDIKDRVEAFLLRVTKSAEAILQRQAEEAGLVEAS